MAEGFPSFMEALFIQKPSHFPWGAPPTLQNCFINPAIQAAKLIRSTTPASWINVGLCSLRDVGTRVEGTLQYALHNIFFSRIVSGIVSTSTIVESTQGLETTSTQWASSSTATPSQFKKLILEPLRALKNDDEIYLQNYVKRIKANNGLIWADLVTEFHKYNMWNIVPQIQGVQVGPLFSGYHTITLTGDEFVEG